MYDLKEHYDKIRFGTRSLEFFELSPFYFCTFVVNNKKWRTLIHYWVASYFKKDSDMMETIRNIDTPEKVIMIAQRYGFKDFNQIDPKDMIYAIQERFNQNDGIKIILLSTGLVPLEYVGKGYLGDGNRYGKLLMKLRDIYAVE